MVFACRYHFIVMPYFFVAFFPLPSSYIFFFQNIVDYRRPSFFCSVTFSFTMLFVISPIPIILFPLDVLIPILVPHCLFYSLHHISQRINLIAICKYKFFYSSVIVICSLIPEFYFLRTPGIHFDIPPMSLKGTLLFITDDIRKKFKLKVTSSYKNYKSV